MAKRTAIVAGSARDIGESIARCLAAEGYVVCTIDIASAQEIIDNLIIELNITHGANAAIGYGADVTQPEQVKAKIQESVKTLGPLTVMVEYCLGQALT